MFMINGGSIVLLGFIGSLITRSIVIARKHRNQIHVSWFKEMITFLFIMYLCMVAAVTLFPLPIGYDFQYVNVVHFINFVPLVGIFDAINQIGTAYDGDVLFMVSRILRNVGGNILLLMPLGFFAPVVWNKFRGFKEVILLGLAVSVTIEILQLVENVAGAWGRITDIDDVICNVLGAGFGYLIYRLILKAGEKYQIKGLKNFSS
ncbi:VanZ family protein [Metabacillus sp. JX24]|uniref:VanZ family protein n=1 Tax=Metabacillus sp. JX24 TaxID=3240759 RepID=UPI00350F27B5